AASLLLRAMGCIYPSFLASFSFLISFVSLSSSFTSIPAHIAIFLRFFLFLKYIHITKAKTDNTMPRVSFDLIKTSLTNDTNPTENKK
ncbi:MAG: hypothetical protein NZM04_05550, partial [Methylacidiphilales bacterium]|nr:hypothetical protein [Candidatus Methylacidiphilales bacterium]